ncbi:DUF6325 family protein [Streptomyces polyrhachis]
MAVMGPVEFVVLTFPGERLNVGAVAALERLRRSGAVRLIDSLVVTRSAESGEAASAHPAELPELAALFPADERPELITPHEAHEAASLLSPGDCALLLLVEHLWAAEAAQAVCEAGGRIAASVRIAPDRMAGAHAGALATA